MTYFRVRPGTGSTVFRLKKPFPDIAAFDSAVRSLVIKNPLGCTSYRSITRNHPPVEIVREMYTAKFVYHNAKGKLAGRGSEVYDSAGGYATGIAAVISNMANIASHRGGVEHTPDADLFSVILKCHDPEHGHYFISMARNRITLSSCSEEEIRRRARAWVKGIPVRH
jgi:hypothetical protein